MDSLRLGVVLLFVILRLVRRKMLPALRQNFINGHVLMLLVRRVIMNMNTQHIRYCIIDGFLHPRSRSHLHS